mmetsp:Transcript_32632/g.104182  ORF Transcript_32632/g.104182 Transcript_32632/m.104182 type:complete len:279 (+) Transcript_32632:1053-1889(+)
MPMRFSIPLSVGVASTFSYAFARDGLRASKMVTTPPHSITPRKTKAEASAFSTRSATTAVMSASEILTASSPHTLVPSACAAVKTWEMAAGPMPSMIILYVLSPSLDAVSSKAWMALPTPSCTPNPTQSNSQNDIRPPSTPAREMPMAVAICVDVGPGIACPSDMSSMKRCSSSHFFFPSTNVLRKRPMCACGPPNAMNPIGKNAMVTSSRRAPYVSAVASTPLSTGAPAAWLLPAGSACTATAGSASVATSTALGVTAAVAAIETQGETRTPLIGSK